MATSRSRFFKSFKLNDKPKQKIAWNTKETASSLLWHTAFFNILADIIPCCNNGALITFHITIFDYAGEKEKTGKNCTWKFLEVRLYSIAIYVLVMWCYILPDSDNHTRSIVKLKYRLD